MATPTWAPTTVQVASYVTSRTVDYATPGSDTPAGDFTADTYPTAAQVRNIINDACAWVVAGVGTLDASLVDLARAAAAVRSAGMVELSFPIRDADVSSTADAFLREADKLMERLHLTNTGKTGTDVAPGTTLLPQYTFPDPAWWGDRTYL